MGTFINCLGECKLFQTFWKAFWQYIINSLKNIHLFGSLFHFKEFTLKKSSELQSTIYVLRCTALFIREGKVEINLIVNKRKVRLLCRKRNRSVRIAP